MITLWLKLKGWLIGAGAFVLLVLSAWLLGRSKGKAAQKVVDAARDAEANAQAAQQKVQAQETRHAVEAEVSKLPDAPPQKVADADPATAAGKLRDGGWLRAPDDHQD